MGKKKNYESPFIERTQVETESGFCAGSESSIEKGQNPNVEVDDYISIENDVTFE